MIDFVAISLRCIFVCFEQVLGLSGVVGINLLCRLLDLVLHVIVKALSLLIRVLCRLGSPIAWILSFDHDLHVFVGKIDISLICLLLHLIGLIYAELTALGNLIDHDGLVFDTACRLNSGRPHRLSLWVFHWLVLILRCTHFIRSLGLNKSFLCCILLKRAYGSHPGLRISLQSLNSLLVFAIVLIREHVFHTLKLCAMLIRCGIYSDHISNIWLVELIDGWCHGFLGRAPIFTRLTSHGRWNNFSFWRRISKSWLFWFSGAHWWGLDFRDRPLFEEYRRPICIGLLICGIILRRFQLFLLLNGCDFQIDLIHCLFYSLTLGLGWSCCDCRSSIL